MNQHWRLVVVVMTTVVVIVVAVTKVVVTKNMTDGCDHNHSHNHSRIDCRSCNRNYCYIDAFITATAVQLMSVR